MLPWSPASIVMRVPETAVMGPTTSLWFPLFPLFPLPVEHAPLVDAPVSLTLSARKMPASSWYETITLSQTLRLRLASASAATCRCRVEPSPVVTSKTSVPTLTTSPEV